MGLIARLLGRPAEQSHASVGDQWKGGASTAQSLLEPAVDAAVGRHSDDAIIVPEHQAQKMSPWAWLLLAAAVRSHMHIVLVLHIYATHLGSCP